MNTKSPRFGYPINRMPDPLKLKVHKKTINGRHLERYKMDDTGMMLVLHATKGWRKFS